MITETQATVADFTFAAEKLQTALDALDALSTHWDRRGLPGDFLTGETYPFGMEFDEQIAEKALTGGEA